MTKYLSVVIVFAVLSVVRCHLTTTPKITNGENRTKSGRSFENTIKTCIQTCRRLLFRGDKDLNYCIEGCRIRIYRKIYDCVYEQCNDNGNGIPGKFSREQYHQCVYLCKVKPKVKPPKTVSTTASTVFSTSTATPGVPQSSAATPSMATPVPKTHFIPLEYHYFTDKKKKGHKEGMTKHSIQFV